MPYQKYLTMAAVTVVTIVVVNRVPALAKAVYNKSLIESFISK